MCADQQIAVEHEQHLFSSSHLCLICLIPWLLTSSVTCRLFSQILFPYMFSKIKFLGRWRSWLRHCATSRKVAGSILSGVTGTFHSHNPSGCIMALGSTQSRTEMSTRNSSWGGGRRPISWADNLTTFMCDCLEIWEPDPQGPSRPV